MLLLNGLLALWLLFHPRTALVHKPIDNLLQALGPLGMALWASRRLWRSPLASRQRWGLQLLLLGGGGFGLGQLVWGSLETFTGKTPPFPSIADAIWTPSLLAILPGILLLSSERASAVARLRVLLDSLTTLMALFTFSWYYILGPTLLNNRESFLTRVASAFYPTFDLLLVFSALLLSLLPGNVALRLTTLKLSWALMIVIVTDTCFSYLSLQGTYQTGGILDVGWPLGWMLVGLSVDRLRQVVATLAQSPAQTAPRQPFWRFLIPYLLLPALGVLAIWVARTPGDERLASGVFLCSLVTVLLVVARQIIALLENRELYERIVESKRALEREHAVSAAVAQQLKEANAQLVATQSELLSNNLALAEANVRLATMATIDGMTGLANHRTFQERLRLELSLSTHRAQGCALLLLDVDHFKSYNDTFGHPAGDQVLCQVAHILQAHLSDPQLAARYGGEEFALLLPGSNQEATLALAETLRTAIAGHAFPNRAVSVSIGIALSPNDASDPESLILAADQALYHSKHQGRNRVTLASDLFRLRDLLIT